MSAGDGYDVDAENDAAHYSDADWPMFVRKRPVIVSAYRYSGTNAVDIVTWIRSLGGNARYVEHELVIETPDGWHDADPGDYVMYGTQGEFYEISQAVFDDVYEPVEGWRS